MLARLTLLLPALALGQCGQDETATAYGAAGQVWQAQSIDGVAFAAEATLRFPEPGRIAGQGPCNSFTARLDAPYPWFEIADLVATRAACPELEAEGAFFAALLAMEQIEVSGAVLILRNEAGHEMLFRAAD